MVKGEQTVKYIRTKDGNIFDYAICEKIIINGTKWLLISKDGNYNLVPNQIIKQADTIEELCDEIIGILNKNIECERYETSLRIGDKLWFDDLEDAQYNKKYCSEIYGAIWTDKGLQFVARMNSKGELELL